MVLPATLSQPRPAYVYAHMYKRAHTRVDTYVCTHINSHAHERWHVYTVATHWPWTRPSTPTTLSIAIPMARRHQPFVVMALRATETSRLP